MEASTRNHLLAAVEEHGSPLYVYDGQEIKNQYDRLTKAFSSVEKLTINYACKALTNISILKLLRSFGSKLDTVSIQEIQIGLKAGYLPEEILYTPNCVGFEEIARAVDLGVKINIDNIEMLEHFGLEYPNKPVCVRINPHIMAGGNSKISVGHIDSKFGISIHQMPLVHRLVKTLKIKVSGIHMHTGSDILDIGVFMAASQILFNVAKEFEDLEFLDFGSGFKVPYKPGDIETDIEQLGEEMSAAFNNFCKDYGKTLELIFEPGKFLVSKSGYFLTNVNVVKQTTSTIFAGLDSGFNHLIRPMFYGSHHEIENLSNTAGKRRIYTVVGYICETDTFGVNRVINEITPGDVLVFKNAGAYCFTMSSNYNSRYRPAEVLIWNDERHLIREREDLNSLLEKQIPISLD